MSTKATIAMGDGWHLFSCCWTGTTHIELNLDVHPDIDKLHIDRWPWLEVDDCESGEQAEIWLPDDVVAAIADYHCHTVSVTRAEEAAVARAEQAEKERDETARLYIGLLSQRDLPGVANARRIEIAGVPWRIWDAGPYATGCAREEEWQGTRRSER